MRFRPATVGEFHVSAAVWPFGPKEYARSKYLVQNEPADAVLVEFGTQRARYVSCFPGGKTMNNTLKILMTATAAASLAGAAMAQAAGGAAGGASGAAGGAGGMSGPSATGGTTGGMTGGTSTNGSTAGGMTSGSTTDGSTSGSSMSSGSNSSGSMSGTTTKSPLALAPLERKHERLVHEHHAPQQLEHHNQHASAVTLPPASERSSPGIRQAAPRGRLFRLGPIPWDDVRRTSPAVARWVN